MPPSAETSLSAWHRTTAPQNAAEEARMLELALAMSRAEAHAPSDATPVMDSSTGRSNAATAGLYPGSTFLPVPACSHPSARLPASGDARAVSSSVADPCSIRAKGMRTSATAGRLPQPPAENPARDPCTGRPPGCESSADGGLFSGLQRLFLGTTRHTAPAEHMPAAVRVPDTSNDEQLARRLYEEEMTGLMTPQSSQHDPTPSAPPPPAFDCCAGCGAPLNRAGMMAMLAGSSRYVTAGGRRYHPQCLRCSGCRDVLEGAYSVGQDGGPYHPQCLRELLAPKCDCCKGSIPLEGTAYTFIDERFWGERYCPAHRSDGTAASCCACGRMRPAASEDVVALDDGRHLCLQCLASMLPDTAAAQPLFREVLIFYAAMGMPLPETPPMMLVEHSALNEYRAHETGAAAAAGPVTHTRGICLSEQYDTIRVASLFRRGGGPGPLSTAHDRVPIERTRTRHVTVTAILVLAGLPRLMTGSIVAHELMHAWLRMAHYSGLPEQTEEGLCQLMAYLWIERQVTQEGTFDAKLASFVAHQIRTDRSEVYGDGFRAALAGFQDMGLSQMLKHVQLTSQLP